MPSAFAAVSQVCVVSRTVVETGPSTRLPTPDPTPQINPPAAIENGSSRPQSRQQALANRLTNTGCGLSTFARTTRSIKTYARPKPIRAPRVTPTPLGHATEDSASVTRDE